MKAAYLIGERSFELRDIELAQGPPGHIDVKVLACGICGSDLHSWHHPELNITGAKEPIPGFTGHEIVVEHDSGHAAIEPNRLTACSECEACRSGASWFCRNRSPIGAFGFAERMRVPTRSLFTLPGTVSPRLGTLVEPLACAVHTIRFSSTAGETARIDGATVAVLGAGVTGLLTVAAARALGADHVAISARHPHQRSAAEAMGADRIIEADAETAYDELRAVGADLVVECVGGSAPTLPLALRVVKPRGEIAVFGVFDGPQELDVRRAGFKEIRLFFPITYAVRNGVHDFDVAIEMLAADPARYAGLITHTFALDDLDEAFAAAADKGSGAIRVVVQP